MADHKEHKAKQGQSEAIHCKVKACKHNPSKFGFCTEHFDQFKFGLINKVGEPCMDHDKKLDQYEAHKAKRKSA